MLTTAFIFALSLTSVPQARKAMTPDFSGIWVLDLKQSNFGAAPSPASRTDTITQAGKSIKDHRTATLADGDHTMDVVFDLSGAETKTQAIGGEMRVTAAWKGSTLVVTSHGSSPGGEVTVVEEWQLSADRKTITVHRKTTGPNGPAEATIVLTRQPAAAK
jgi:hypothetical protein